MTGSARMAQNPPILKSRIRASVPPEITKSAEPLRISSVPSPTACVPVAQAVAMVLFGPVHWNCLAIMKAARLGMPDGSVKGFTLSNTWLK